MTDIKWRKFPNEKPKKEKIGQRPCVVLVPFINGDGQKDHGLFVDYFNADKDRWNEHCNDEISHWFYLDEIPIPKYELKV